MWNDPRQRIAGFEINALQWLQRGIRRARDRPWFPDLIIKMFHDIDIVFFHNCLTGNVVLCWGHYDLPPNISNRAEKLYAHTTAGGNSRPRVSQGQAQIMLNARPILEAMTSEGKDDGLGFAFRPQIWPGG